MLCMQSNQVAKRNISLMRLDTMAMNARKLHALHAVMSGCEKKHFFDEDGYYGDECEKVAGLACSHVRLRKETFSLLRMDTMAMNARRLQA